jgi:DNA-binding transcriptional ArsR family regulator
MRRAHEAARAVLRALIDRRRREGAFRTDLPTALLVTSYLALIHATAEETRACELDPAVAIDALSVLVTAPTVGNTLARLREEEAVPRPRLDSVRRARRSRADDRALSASASY